MTQITSYVLTLLGVCIVCGAITALAPRGNFEQILRTVSGIFLLLCMIAPLSDVISGITSYTSLHIDSGEADEAKTVWDYSADIMEDNLKKEINKHLKQVIGHEAKQINLSVVYEGDTFQVEEFIITVNADDYMRQAAIADYVEMQLGVRPSVIFQ